MAHFRTDTGVLVDRYEHLREEVLSNEVGSRLGLGVFLRQGMVGWMKVQSFLSAPKAPAPVPGVVAAAPLPKGLMGELTTILTELILTKRSFMHEGETSY